MSEVPDRKPGYGCCVADDFICRVQGCGDYEAIWRRPADPSARDSGMTAPLVPPNPNTVDQHLTCCGGPLDRYKEGD